MLKRIITIVLTIALLSSIMAPMASALAPNAVLEDEKLWGVTLRHGDGREVPFRPENKYISRQNPPDFTWPQIQGQQGITYDLVVALDPELKDVKYSQDKIPANYFTFPHTFETGIEYYWAVRYHQGSKTSPWSVVRRFRIDPDAHEFTSPGIDEMISRIPKEHPRVYFVRSKLAEQVSYADLYTDAAGHKHSMVSKADLLITKNELPVEPVYNIAGMDPNTKATYDQTFRGVAQTGVDDAETLAKAYLLTGDVKYAKLACAFLDTLADWDINGATSYKNQDQVHRYLAYHMAIAYDWVIDHFTPEQKKNVEDHIIARVDVMKYLLDSIPKSPYDSHGWTAYGYIGIIGLALYGERPEGEEYLRSLLPVYTSFVAPWSYQDGGWSQGTDYWQYSTAFAIEFMDALYELGVINLFDRAWCKEQYNWILYAYPFNSRGSFGDQSNRTKASAGTNGAVMASDVHSMEYNPVRVWAWQQYSDTISGTQDYIKAKTFNEIFAGEKVDPPVHMPLAHEFDDIGWVNMTNSLADPGRILMTFKSSHFGSYNHSHPDQNSFIIEAFGENLAIKSGYYDFYHSAHDSGFTRKTGAHNSVTVANSQGQQDDSFAAKGHLTSFLHHPKFDLVSGDATDAYAVSARVGQFERHMLYLRPDMFVVIDELKSSNPRGAKFEWWLNAEHDIEVYEEGNGARLTENVAVLDASVKYPQTVNTYYNNMFALSDMVDRPAGGAHASMNVQRRVWFETEKVTDTKMIVTMDVHRKGTEARYTDTEYFEDCVRLNFENGTVVIVNLGEPTETVTLDDITFTGTAVAYTDDSIMLVTGTELAVGGKTIVKAEKEMSFVMGDGEMSVSTYDDNKVSVNTDNDFVSGIDSITNFYGTPVSPEYGVTVLDGIIKAEEAKEENNTAKKSTAKKEEAEETAPVVTYTVEEADDYITLDLKKDNYAFMLNGKTSEAKEVATTLDVYVNGEKQETAKIEGFVTREGTHTITGKFSVTDAKYLIKELSDNVAIDAGVIKGEAAFMKDVPVTMSSLEPAVIELVTVPSNQVQNIDAGDDYDAAKAKLNIFVEAEDFDTLPAGASAYSTRSFLSGGKGVQQLNKPGTIGKYTVEVTEAGVYDFAVKYVAWDPVETRRSLGINGADYIFTLPQTVSWGTSPEQWKYIVADTNIYLEPGSYSLSLSPLTGSWNFDWFGFVKSE